MNDDQTPTHGLSGLRFILTGSFDAHFTAQLAEAFVEVAHANGKQIDAAKLTPSHILVVVSNLGDDGRPQPEPTAPDPQHGVDRLVARMSC